MVALALTVFVWMLQFSLDWIRENLLLSKPESLWTTFLAPIGQKYVIDYFWLFGVSVCLNSLSQLVKNIFDQWQQFFTSQLHRIAFIFAHLCRLRLAVWNPSPEAIDLTFTPLQLQAARPSPPTCTLENLITTRSSSILRAVWPTGKLITIAFCLVKIASVCVFLGPLHESTSLSPVIIIIICY